MSKHAKVSQLNEYLKENEANISQALSKFLREQDPAEMGSKFPLKFHTVGLTGEFYIFRLDNRDKLELDFNELLIESSEEHSELVFDGAVHSTGALGVSARGYVEISGAASWVGLGGTYPCEVSFTAEGTSGGGRVWFSLFADHVGGLLTDGMFEDLSVGIPRVSDFDLRCKSDNSVSTSIINLVGNTLGKTLSVFSRNIPDMIRDAIKETAESQTKKKLNNFISVFAPSMFLEGFHAFNKWLNEEQRRRLLSVIL